MTKTYTGRTIDCHCAFPACTGLGEHEHHVIYRPPVTKRLCRQRHEEITMLNGIQGRKVRHTLTDQHRWWIWYQWTQGRLKPRRTKKALQYVQEWDSDL